MFNFWSLTNCRKSRKGNFPSVESQVVRSQDGRCRSFHTRNALRLHTSRDTGYCFKAKFIKKKGSIIRNKSDETNDATECAFQLNFQNKCFFYNFHFYNFHFREQQVYLLKHKYKWKCAWRKKKKLILICYACLFYSTT